MLSEDKFPKYPKIRRLNHPKTPEVLTEDTTTLVVQEKMDGSNFRFTFHEGEVVFGSRNTVLGSATEVGEHDIGGQFEGVVDHILERVDWGKLQYIDEQTEDFVVYGENMYPHTVEYDRDETPRFLAFDIWYRTIDGMEKYMHPSEMVSNVEDGLGLETVPHEEILDVEDFDPDTYLEEYESPYAKGRAEGIVMTNPDGYPSHVPLKAKQWTEQFAETHKSSKNPANEQVENDTQEFVRDVITEQRVRNQAEKLVEEGEWDAMQMEMMEDLPMRVIDDAIEEEGHELVRSNMEIDFGELRSDASSKCASILRRIMVE